MPEAKSEGQSQTPIHEYLRILDWTSRQVRSDLPSSDPAQLAANSRTLGIAERILD